MKRPTFMMLKTAPSLLMTIISKLGAVFRNGGVVMGAGARVAPRAVAAC